MGLSSEPPFLPPNPRAKAPVHTSESIPSRRNSAVTLCQDDLLRASRDGPLLSSPGPFRPGSSCVVISNPNRQTCSPCWADLLRCRHPAIAAGAGFCLRALSQLSLETLCTGSSVWLVGQREGSTGTSQGTGGCDEGDSPRPLGEAAWLPVLRPCLPTARLCGCGCDGPSLHGRPEHRELCWSCSWT